MGSPARPDLATSQGGTARSLAPQLSVDRVPIVSLPVCAPINWIDKPRTTEKRADDISPNAVIQAFSGPSTSISVPLSKTRSWPKSHSPDPVWLGCAGSLLPIPAKNPCIWRGLLASPRGQGFRKTNKPRWSASTTTSWTTPSDGGATCSHEHCLAFPGSAKPGGRGRAWTCGSCGTDEFISASRNTELDTSQRYILRQPGS